MSTRRGHGTRVIPQSGERRRWSRIEGVTLASFAAGTLAAAATLAFFLAAASCAFALRSSANRRTVACALGVSLGVELCVLGGAKLICWLLPPLPMPGYWGVTKGLATPVCGPDEPLRPARLRMNIMPMY